MSRGTRLIGSALVLLALAAALGAREPEGRRTASAGAAPARTRSAPASGQLAKSSTATQFAPAPSATTLEAPGDSWFYEQAAEWNDNPIHGWVQLDFLLWARKGRYLPPLVTTAPNDGVLPEATLVLGSENVGERMRPGGRLRLGTWLDCAGTTALEGGLLMLGPGDVGRAFTSDEFPTLARPFFNVAEDPGDGIVGQDALTVALPGVASGNLLVTSGSEIVWADATWRHMLSRTPLLRLDLLAGYVGGRIDEDLVIASSSRLAESNTTIDITDAFRTRNDFHGGHFGFELQRRFPRGSLEFLSRIGVGQMEQSVDISGQRVTTVGDVTPSIVPNGLLAQPTNIGQYRRNEFAVAPELGLRANWQLTCHLGLSAGYSFLYWNRVVQPGDQIDLAVNPDQPPPADQPQRPAFSFHDGSYYLHGLHLGVYLTR